MVTIPASSAKILHVTVPPGTLVVQAYPSSGTSWGARIYADDSRIGGMSANVVAVNDNHLQATVTATGAMNPGAGPTGSPAFTPRQPQSAYSCTTAVPTGVPTRPPSSSSTPTSSSPTTTTTSDTPTNAPTSASPTAAAGSPTNAPTSASPTAAAGSPTNAPTSASPTGAPSSAPTSNPTTATPTAAPSTNPTVTPGSPTRAPTTKSPTASPSKSPTLDQTVPITCNSGICFCGFASVCTCEGQVTECRCQNSQTCNCNAASESCRGDNAGELNVAPGLNYACDNANTCNGPPTASPPSSASRRLNPVALVIGALLIVCASASSSRTSGWTVLVLVALTSVMVAAVPAPLWYCQRGTLVIEYPPGAQIFVNGQRLPTCTSEGGTSAVQTPTLKIRHKYEGGGTFWLGSPIIIDMDQNLSCTGANCKEIIMASGGSVQVYDSQLVLLQDITDLSWRCNTMPGGNPARYDFCAGINFVKRVFAPEVVVDIDNDGVLDLIVAAGTQVWAFAWDTNTRKFITNTPKWVKDISSLSDVARTIPTDREIRGLSVADVDGDGDYEIFCSTTDSIIQMYGFDHTGAELAGWPRYNQDNSTLGDGTGTGGNNGRNGQGHYRFGSYGLNVGIGNIDDDADLEIFNTYDNHQIQAFKRDGLAINMAPEFQNPRNNNGQRGNAMTWGQVSSRWTRRSTDENHYAQPGGNTLCFPNPGNSGCDAGGDEWMQGTDTPPSIIDIDRDGKNEAFFLMNSEKGIPYVSQDRVILALDGAYGNGGDPTVQAPRSGHRHAGFDEDWPPQGGPFGASNGEVRTIPAPSFTDLRDDGMLSLVAAFGDGTVRAFDHQGNQSWVFDYAAHMGKDAVSEPLHSSEITVCDLNRDGVPEFIFNVYGMAVNPPTSNNNQKTFALDNCGQVVWEQATNGAGAPYYGEEYNGNGNGAAGAPSCGDVDDDGTVEVISHTFDGRIFMWSFPGSAENCLWWPTARGGHLRKGQPDAWQ